MHIICVNDTWLYEPPQTAPFPIRHVKLPEASTPLKTPPMNPKTLIKNVVPLDIPIVFNPQIPKSINEASYKKRSIVVQFDRGEKEIFFNSQNDG
jgi:hypothetical protein